MNDQAPKQSLRTGSNMSLPAIDLFEGVETADSAHSGAWNRLTVDNQCAGLPVATRSAPDCTGGNGQEVMVKMHRIRPSSRHRRSPPAKVVVRGPPLSKFSGQHPPLGSCFDHEQDCIQHVVAKRGASLAAGRKIAADLFPLGAERVVAIALLAHGSGKSFSEEIVDSFRKRGGLPSVLGPYC